MVSIHSDGRQSHQSLNIQITLIFRAADLEFNFSIKSNQLVKDLHGRLTKHRIIVIIMCENVMSVTFAMYENIKEMTVLSPTLIRTWGYVICPCVSYLLGSLCLLNFKRKDFKGGIL